MSDNIPKETGEDKLQEHEEEDDDPTSSRDESTANKELPEEGGTEDLLTGKDKQLEHGGKDGEPTSSKVDTLAKEESSDEDETEDLASRLNDATKKGFLEEGENSVEGMKAKFLSMPIDEKRKLYKCRSNYVLLKDIETWPERFQNELKDDEKISKWWERNKREVMRDVEESLNNKISLFRGDITTLEIDAIVNAAHESLLGGSGVDGAIHSAAGPRLLSECRSLNGCQNGFAEITGGYKLPAKYVIHSVGPRGEYPDVLESCYKECLDLMQKHQLKSVAFPCISTGVFGYPNRNAAIVALRTVREWLETEEYAKNVTN